MNYNGKIDGEIAVSIMITYYNQKKYIADSIGSVLNQKTNFRYEILCGDDGSTDGSYEELLEWRNRYPDVIRVFRMDRNDGKKEPIIRASNNRYNLYKHAIGNYITILDGDDFYTSNDKLQLQFDILENDKTLSACCHPMNMVWDGKKELRKIGINSKNAIRMSVREYLLCYWIPAEAFLFRRSTEPDLINENFFDDNLITMYFIKGGDIYYLPKIMAAYRQRPESSWNKRNNVEKCLVNIKGYEETIKIMKEYRLCCFARYCEIYNTLFRNKKQISEFKEESLLEIHNKMFSDTLKFNEMNWIDKIAYDFRYFMISHCKIIVKPWVKIMRFCIKRKGIK